MVSGFPPPGAAIEAPLTFPLDAPGLMPARIDGVLELGTEGRVDEWADAISRAVPFADEAGRTVTANVSLKVVGSDLFVAAQLPFPSAPSVYLLLDLNGDGVPDRLLGTRGNESWNLVAGEGQWESPEPYVRHIGLARTQLDGQRQSWVSEFAYPLEVMGAGQSPLGWSLVAVAAGDASSYRYPNPATGNEPCGFGMTAARLPQVGPACFMPLQAEGQFDWNSADLLPPTAVWVSAIEVTQAIQTAGGAMPLVLGKDSLARVFVRNDSPPTRVEVTLYAEAVQTPASISVPMGFITREYEAVGPPTRDRIDGSINFLIPWGWTAVELLRLTAQVRVMDGLAVPKPLLSTTLSRTFLFQETHDLVIYMVPVNESGRYPAEESLRAHADALAAAYPVADPLFPWLGPETLGPWSGTEPRLMEELTETGWLIIVAMLLAQAVGDRTNVPFPDQIAGFKSQGRGRADASWYPSTNPDGDSLALWLGPFPSNEMVLAHEMGHNVGPYNDTTGDFGVHIGGCGAEAADREWRALYGRDDFAIHDVGWDPRVDDPESGPDALIAADYPDFMSYCDVHEVTAAPQGTTPNQWISTYRWPLYFERFRDWNASPPGYHVASPAADASSTVRVIRGYARSDGTVELLKSFETPGILPDNYQSVGAAGTRYEQVLEVVGPNGSVLNTIHIDPSFRDVEGADYSESHFIYLVPDNGLVNEIRLFARDGTLIDSYAASLTPAVQFESVPTSFERGKPGRVSWSELPGPGSGTKPLEYQLEYSPDGVAWIRLGQRLSTNHADVLFDRMPGSDQGRLRLRASNGLDTAFAVSDPFTVPFQQVFAEVDGSTSVILAGSLWEGRLQVTDPDFLGSDGGTTTWTVDGSAALSGESVRLELRDPGTHEVVGTHTNSRGISVSATQTLTVGPRALPTTTQLRGFLEGSRGESEGEPLPGPGGSSWLLLAVVAGIAFTVVALAWWARRRAREEP